MQPMPRGLAQTIMRLEELMPGSNTEQGSTRTRRQGGHVPEHAPYWATLLQPAGSPERADSSRTACQHGDV